MPQVPLKLEPPPRPAQPRCLASKAPNATVTTSPPNQSAKSSLVSENKSPSNSLPPHLSSSSSSAKSPTTTVTTTPSNKSRTSSSASGAPTGSSFVHNERHIPDQSSEKLSAMYVKSKYSTFAFDSSDDQKIATTVCFIQ